MCYHSLGSETFDIIGLCLFIYSNGFESKSCKSPQGYVMHVLGLLLLKCIESQSLESQRGPKNSDSFALAKLASSHSQEVYVTSVNHSHFKGGKGYFLFFDKCQTFFN